MAFSLFGKKDKNPPEAAAPVAKAPPTPPKIQNPPAQDNAPVVKPPQPAGLIPATGKHTAAATTQPMVMPRGGAGLKPARPGVAQSSRSTQRIVLPTGTPGTKPTSTKSLASASPTGRINLPMGMILRCLPQEVLASDLAEFEASGAASTEIGIPMNMILSQLPSGKVEMPLSDLVPHFPAGFLQPTESIASYLPTLINLPLMDVVMRIPPDLLSLRPDQKDVDAAVINMADPFTEEILREQAEAARRQAAQQTQTNIIDESQAPQEEFVPRDQAGPKTIAPPPRPSSMPLPSPTAQTSKMPAPPLPASAAGISQSPSASARTISPSGRLPVPTRATTAIPTRPAPAAPAPLSSPAPRQTSSVPAPPVPRQTSSVAAPPVPPVPRQTGALPSIAAIPRQTASIPQPPRPPAAPAPVALPPEPPPVAEVSEPPFVEPPVAAPVASTPDNSDDLQRLAALAMAEMGDNDEEPATPPPSDSIAATAPLPPEPEPEPAPQAVAAPEPEPTPEPVEEPAPVIPEPVAVTPPVEPEPAPAPEPIAVLPPPVPTPVPVEQFTPPPVAEQPKLESQPMPDQQTAGAAASGNVAFNLNTCTADDLVQNIPGCFRELAESIVRHRTKIGSFRKLEDLLDVPGITKAAYTNLTGEAPPDNRIPLSLTELLGFPAEQHISLKDVTDRIACWPDVTGCILSQSTGLSLVGTVPDGLDKAAIVAFAPRMFEALNKSLVEITGRETDDLIIPSYGNSFHIFRNKDLYLIILSRTPQMPERHMKVARFVIAALSVRRD